MTMTQKSPLRDHFLISMPHLNDDIFAHAVTYVCDHSEYGAMGFIINQPSNLSLGELVIHLDLKVDQRLPMEQLASIPVYIGGPVGQDRGFVLHRHHDEENWLATYHATDTLDLTTSLDVIEAIAGGQITDDYILTLGYASWGPGQLEREIADNLWLSCPADLDILFRMPAEERLQAAASVLGINLNQLSANVGHA